MTRPDSAQEQPARNSRQVLERLEESGHLPAGSTRRSAPLFASRNRIVHLYDHVNALIAYKTPTEERKDLLTLLDLFLTIADPA